MPLAMLKQAISPKTGIIVASAVVCVYVLFIVMSLSQGHKAIEHIESNMAMQSSTVHNATLHARDTNADNDPHPIETFEEYRKPLPSAPYEQLVQHSRMGPLPVIGKNNLKPFDAYKKPFEFDAEKPTIAIGISGIGFSSGVYNYKGNKGAVFNFLSPHASVILSPYIQKINIVQKEARNHGYETWIEVPLQTEEFPRKDPGRLGIYAKSGMKNNQENYRQILSYTSGYAGVALYTDQTFSQAQTVLNAITGDIFSRGLGMVELNSGKNNLSRKLAVNARAPYVKNTLKEQRSKPSDAFKQLKKEATQNRQAIGILEVTPILLDSFKREVLKAQEEGFEIVPLSALADQL